jgi:hypothetical protein
MAPPRGIRGNKEVPHIPSEACVAKTTPGGQPGMSAREHCEHVRPVAAELLERLPDSSKRLIPNDVISLVVIHAIGKVSLNFQKSIHSDPEESLPPKLIQRSIEEFETDLYKTSEASLVSLSTKRKICLE